jgi:hypothetical protein
MMTLMFVMYIMSMMALMVEFHDGLDERGVCGVHDGFDDYAVKADLEVLVLLDRI